MTMTNMSKDDIRKMTTSDDTNQMLSLLEGIMDANQRKNDQPLKENADLEVPESVQKAEAECNAKWKNLGFPWRVDVEMHTFKNYRYAVRATRTDPNDQFTRGFDRERDVIEYLTKGIRSQIGPGPIMESGETLNENDVAFQKGIEFGNKARECDDPATMACNFSKDMNVVPESEAYHIDIESRIDPKALSHIPEKWAVVDKEGFCLATTASRIEGERFIAGVKSVEDAVGHGSLAEGHLNVDSNKLQQIVSYAASAVTRGESGNLDDIVDVESAAMAGATVERSINGYYSKNLIQAARDAASAFMHGYEDGKKGINDGSSTDKYKVFDTFLTTSRAQKSAYLAGAHIGYQNQINENMTMSGYSHGDFEELYQACITGQIETAEDIIAKGNVYRGTKEEIENFINSLKQIISRPCPENVKNVCIDTIGDLTPKDEFGEPIMEASSKSEPVYAGKTQQDTDNEIYDKVTRYLTGPAANKATKAITALIEARKMAEDAKKKEAVAKEAVYELVDETFVGPMDEALTRIMETKNAVVTIAKNSEEKEIVSRKINEEKFFEGVELIVTKDMLPKIMAWRETCTETDVTTKKASKGSISRAQLKEGFGDSMMNIARVFINYSNMFRKWLTNVFDRKLERLMAETGVWQLLPD